MPINQAILEKRKALGLTQEQVANALGVTAPAVNKWEKGTTCPDLTLLPLLARLLKTDPNTLLCFEESLTKQEITRLLMKRRKSSGGKAMRRALRGPWRKRGNTRAAPSICIPPPCCWTALLDDLEHNTEYDFLRNEPEFAALLADYRAKCGESALRAENENLALRRKQR